MNVNISPVFEDLVYMRRHSFKCTKTEVANEADEPVHGQWLRRHDNKLCDTCGAQS